MTKKEKRRSIIDLFKNFSKETGSTLTNIDDIEFNLYEEEAKKKEIYFENKIKYSPNFNKLKNEGYLEITLFKGFDLPLDTKIIFTYKNEKVKSSYSKEKLSNFTFNKKVKYLI
jgi:hypothetical protein